MFGIMHKPWYTLKTKKGHAPEKAIRQIYQPLFDELGLDFMLYGHNHDFKSGNQWYLMPPTSYKVIRRNVRLPSLTGQFHIVNGAGGHEINQF